MSGTDAIRGFLFQKIISVLLALSEENSWDKIYVEFTNNDKVDIELKKTNTSIKCIQVKSSINLFGETTIKKWLTELIKSTESPVYELSLIGQCDKDANKFIKSINKYYEKNFLDKESQSVLENFNTDLLKNKRIKIKILPCDLNTLKATIRDSLNKYISNKIIEAISFEKLNLITSTILSDFDEISINSNGISKDEFDEKIKKIITTIIENLNNSSPKRIPLKIRSFIHSNKNENEIKTENEDKNTLLLVDDFDERKLKNGLDWNKDISKKVINFLKEKTNKENIYEISLITHLSIAFLAGRQLNSKSGIDIFPIQNETTPWDVNLDRKNKQDYSKWNTNYEILNSDFHNCALILSATKNIYKEVKQYINDFKLPIGKIINCSLEETSSFSIKDGTHAYLLANSINDYVKERSIQERQGVLHIFVAIPNALMFFLGQNSNGFGKCILYEYDFEQKNSCTYSPSIEFID